MRINTSELLSLIGILLLVAAICMAVLDYKHHFIVFFVGVVFSALGLGIDMKKTKRKNDA